MSSDDLLARTLEMLRLRGTVYFQADFGAPWGMAVPASQVAAFHVVVAGQCWLRLQGERSTLLERGDIVLLPHGAAHELVHEEGASAAPAAELLSQPRQETSPVYGGRGAATTLVCGHFDFDREALHPFFETLPEILHLSIGEQEQSSWLATAARLAAAESKNAQRSASVVVDRLAEALLLQTLRLYLDRVEEPRGFLAAVRDPAIGRALSRLHRDAAHDWSLLELAEVAGLSRSSFAERFRGLVGESPMRYLFRWRMLAAREQLQEGSRSTAAIASRVGYSSEFAFAKAFKRFFGKGPGAIRRSA